MLILDRFTCYFDESCSESSDLTSALPDGVYELEVDEEVDYSLLPDDEKMIGFLWKDFGIPTS